MAIYTYLCLKWTTWTLTSVKKNYLFIYFKGHNNPCLIANGGCEDKCNLDASGFVICSCFSGREVLAHNPKRCVEAVVDVYENGTCDENGKHFKCSSHGTCIPFELTCDDVKHCEDGSDEFITYCGG